MPTAASVTPPPPTPPRHGTAPHLIEDAHGQDRERGVHDVIQGDKILVIDGLERTGRQGHERAILLHPESGGGGQLARYVAPPGIVWNSPSTLSMSVFLHA